MITFLQSMSLQKDDIMRLVISGLSFLEGSMYGVVRLGDENVHGVFTQLQFNSNNVHKADQGNF